MWPRKLDGLDIMDSVFERMQYEQHLMMLALAVVRGDRLQDVPLIELLQAVAYAKGLGILIVPEWTREDAQNEG